MITLDKTQSFARARSIRVSPQKLNLVAALIRGMKVDAALLQLQFSKKRVAKEVLKVLKAAISNAVVNNNLDADKLIVQEAWVGKAMVMKRYQPRAKGRAGSILKPFSKLTIVVGEKENAKKALKKESTKKAAKAEKENN